MRRIDPRPGFWNGFLAGLVAMGLMGASGVWAATTLFAQEVAKVNATSITESQLFWYMLIRESTTTLRALVQHAVLAEQAPKLKVSVTPDEIERVLTDLHGDKLALVGGGVDLTEVRAAIGRELLAGKVLKAKRDELAKTPACTVTQEEVVDAYLRNADKMTIPEMRNISVIQTNSLRDAESAQKDLQAGTPFVDVVKQYSQDEVTKQFDGHLPPPIEGLPGIPKDFFRGPMKKIEAAMFTLTVGANSEILSVADEYFIVKLEEIIPAKEIQPEEAYPVLRQKLEDEKIGPEMEKWLQSLSETFTLAVDYPVFPGDERDLKTLEVPDPKGNDAE